MGLVMGEFVMKLGNLSTSDHASVVSMNIFVALLCACIVIGHLLEESRWMNESITALAIGLCTGVVILLTTSGKSSHLLVFSEDLFFIYLLPPIIFNAGFQVKKKQFFRNFITIMLFGAIGTLISFTIVSLGAMHFFKRWNLGSLTTGDFLAIGSIFSATDSVCTLQVLNQDETPLLYSLVFGEGVVNDATSVVLFNAIQSFDLTQFNSTILLSFMGNFSYLFIASTLLGVVSGLLSAYVIKKLYFGRHSTDREVALMILMAYLSYVLAEVRLTVSRSLFRFRFRYIHKPIFFVIFMLCSFPLQLFYLSSILTVFFCGIVMSHYTWHNVTESSRVTTKHTFATMSFIAEIFIFVYVGMDALDIDKWKLVSDSPGKSVAVSSTLLALILIGRAAFVFPLSFLSNLTKKNASEKIAFKQQITIWWAGLMRGAVSMALAYNKFSTPSDGKLRQNAIVITSTISVVLFSTIVFGLLTKPIVKHLLPSKHFTSMTSEEPTSPKSFIVPLLNDQASEFENRHVHRPPSLQTFLRTPTHTVHYYWRKFDNAVMRPMFGGRGFAPFVPGSPIEQSLHPWQ
ncbi:hypothetical protein QQ045_031411 [Rhodiola kirilowii]